MKYFSYFSKDIYTFENLDDLQKAIQYDKIGLVVNIQEQEKYIEYVIDREKVIRLSDLINFISNNLVRIHLGQLLVLVQSLAQKVQKMEEAMIQHYYLDSNRIWLYFTNTMKPSIIYSQLDYVIYFTGYQCPNYEKFNENEDLKIKASKKILQIIKQIILSCYDKIILNQNQNDTKLQVKNNIINPILHDIENKELTSFIKQIDEYLEKYQYNKDKQIINFDEDIEIFSDRRFDNQLNYFLDIKKIILQEQEAETKQQQHLILEYCLYQCLPSIIEQIDNPEQYQRINYNADVTRKEIEKNLSEINDKKNNFIREVLEPEINKQIQYYSQYYKFTFKKDEILNYLLEILSDHAILKYFNNTYTYNFKGTYQIKSDNQQTQNDNLFKAMQKSISQIIPLYVMDYFIMDLNLQILDLINGLI